MVQDQLRNSAYSKAITRVSLRQPYNMLHTCTVHTQVGWVRGRGYRGKGCCMQGSSAMRALPSLISERCCPVYVFAVCAASLALIQ